MISIPGSKSYLVPAFPARRIHPRPVAVPQPIGLESLEPRVLLSSDPVGLVSVGDTWQYFKGTAAPPSDWSATTFDAAAWLSGPSGIGYSSDIAYATDLPDMYAGYVTFYARRAFSVADPEALAELELGIRYDDGFVAYLNGAEVARSPSMGAVGAPTSYTQEAGADHDEEAPEETYSIPLAPGQLLAGDNVLAIEVHNVWNQSSDAGMIPRLAGIGNRSPVAAADLSYSSTTAAPARVTFDAAASADGDGVIVSYDWDFGDGSAPQAGAEAVVAHEYLAAGVYSAVLTVTDDGGDTDTATVLVRIGPGDTYYVADPRGLDGLAGTADDVDASNAYPGTIGQPFATLQKAAAVAVLGDTVLIRGGTYNQALIPQNSGGPQRPITFQAYAGETPTITGASLSPAVDISQRSYLVLQGLTVTDVQRWLYAIDAHYNILQGNHFAHAINTGGSSKGGLFFQEATYNRILDNVIEDNATQDNLSLHVSDYNLIAGNTITQAGHTLWTIKAGNFNVLRDNYFHNPWQKIGEVYDAWGAGFDHQFYLVNSTKHNLITGNIFDYTASSGDHSPFAGIQYAGQDGIIRGNLFYDTVGPGLDLTGYAEEAKYTTGNRVYQNVFSQSDFAGVSFGGVTFEDNVLKNNILSSSQFVANDTRWSWYTQELAGKPVQLMTGRTDGFVFENNDLWGGAGDEPYLITYGSRTSGSNPPQQTLAWWEANYPQLFQANRTEDPGFVDESGRDYRLTAGSAMIDAGAFLTTAVGAGAGTTFPVADASWFYDGYGIPGEVGDEIQFQGQSATAIVVGIDYDQDLLYLDRPMSWTDGLGVALRYSGDAPDLGAIEYQQATANRPPLAEDDDAATDEDVPVTVDVLANDSDPDGDALAVTGFTQGARGNVALDGQGRLVYTPAADFHGADSFTYTVSDGNGGTATGTVNVAVLPVNDPPVAQDDAYETTAGMELVVDASAGVLANDTDVDADPLTAVRISDPANGTLTLQADGSFSYVPRAGYTGADTFQYRAGDGVGLSGIAEVTIQVRASEAISLALAETPGKGAVAGTFLDTHASDDVYEALTEVSRGPRNVLEHTWQFSLSGGDPITFAVEAWHDGEEAFLLQYSTDGSTWTDMLLVTKTADDDAQQTHALAAGLAGPLWIRAVDTDRGKSDREAGTLYVDQMYIRSYSGPVRPTVIAQAPDADASEAGTDAGVFTLRRDGTAGFLPVHYALSGTAENGVDYEP